MTDDNMTPHARDMQRRNDRLMAQILRRAYGPVDLQDATLEFIEERGLKDEYLAFIDERFGPPPIEEDDSPSP